MSEITITLTKSQVDNLLEFFDLGFIRFIHNRIEDEEDELDNMAYLVDMCEVYSKLNSAEPKKMTNFDKIMAMTPKELAEFINNSDAGCACCKRENDDDCGGTDCAKHIREWLEEETE